MITNPTQLDPKDPRETIVITLDASAMLADDETLTNITATEISTLQGNDSESDLVLNGQVINSTELTMLDGTTIAVGCAVQAVATEGKFSSVYWIAVTVETSNPDKVLVLKASLPMSPM